MNFVPFPHQYGARISGVRKAFASAKQDTAKREEFVPVSLPRVGADYKFVAGQLVRDGIALPPREGL